MKSIQMLNAMGSAMSSGQPIDLEQMIERSIWGNSPQEVLNHLLKNKRTLEEEYSLIQEKKSTLSKRLREYVSWSYDKRQEIQSEGGDS